MLESSFVVLPGVRERSEQKLWNSGVRSWNDFLSSSSVKGISQTRKEQFNDHIIDCQRSLKAQDSLFFAKKLRFSDQWRLYNEFKDEAVFLDIETDGYYGGVTVVGMSDGVDAKTMVKGFNLDRKLLMDELSKYKLLITFNGKSFDVPVLERYFGVKIPHAHIDLRFVCQRVGLTGGLKNIEQHMNIRRRAEVLGISGQDAVYLWEMWKSTGERDYLNSLVMYNEEDILNLKPIAEKVIPQLWKKCVDNAGRGRADAERVASRE